MNYKSIEITANDTHHYEVLFFDSHDEAARWLSWEKSYTKPFNALTISRQHITRPVPALLGWIVFAADDFAPSIIQHELLHAAIHYERAVFGNSSLSFADIEAEERLAHTQMHLLDDLLFKMDDAGLAEFGVAPPEPEPERKPFVLDDSNSDLLPDGGRAYPKLKQKTKEANERVQADTRRIIAEMSSHE